MAFDEPETESARLTRLKRDAERLRHDIEWALRRALDPTDVLPMLHRLVRTAKAGSDESVFAYRQLAELIAPRHPWRAALYARRVLSLRPGDDRAWAVLAFAQTLLGHYRFAATAYARALGCTPKNPWYAHNLGHLLDVALGRPEEALPWLASAYAAAKDHSELATSYAHALARSGDVPAAKRVLGRAMRESLRTGDGAPSREQTALWRWLERGAPAPVSGTGTMTSSGPGASAGAGESTIVQSAIFTENRSVVIDPQNDPQNERQNERQIGRQIEHETGPHHDHDQDHEYDHDASRAKTRKRKRRVAGATKTLNALDQQLARGMEHLPLDDRQKARARALAREIGSRDAESATPSRTAVLAGERGGERAGERAGSEARAQAVAQAVAHTAAAIAFSIVDLDEVPLTQAEVAACFRVRAAGLRARYDQLRSELIGVGGTEKPTRATRSCSVGARARRRVIGTPVRKVKK